MKRLLGTVVAVLLSGGFMLGMTSFGSPFSPTSVEQDTPEYVGSKSCRKCHFSEHRSWSATKMANAFDTLLPGKKAEEKRKANLDPNKDYSKDAKCLKCHTTGYGLPGGYPAVVEGKAWTAEETARAELMKGVGCESCHGPGSKANPYKKDHKSYKWSEVEALGMVHPDAKNCATCHNDGSPTHAKFVYEEKVGKDSHPFKKMKADHSCPHTHQGGK